MDSTKMKIIAARKWLEKVKEWIIIDAMCAKTFDLVAIGKDEHIHYIYVATNEYLPPNNIVLKEIEDWRNEYILSFGSFPAKYDIMNVSLTGENKAKIKLINEQFYHSLRK